MMKPASKKLCLFVTVVLAIAMLSGCAGPESTYKQAQNLLSKGMYAEAADKFESIGSYEDASTLTMYCKACALCESGDYETGLAVLVTLGDFKDCTYRITYYTARSYEDLAGKDNWAYMVEAQNIYKTIPVFLDSAERITALDTRIEAAKISQYNAAVNAGESGDYSTALNAFELLGDYSDSKMRYAYYDIRAEEESRAESTDENTFLGLASEYGLMGEYLDCADRAAAMNAKATAILDGKYNAAAELMANGKYEEAIAAFFKIITHKDSASQIEACETAILDGKYDAAMALMTAGKYQEAIAAFNKIITHRDSAAQIDACETAILDGKYDAAMALMTAGKYQEAIAAFNKIKTYRDSAAQIEACETAILDGKYDAAMALMTAGKYQEAIAAFNKIITHKDSTAQIDACETAILDGKYDAAMALMAAGKYGAAYEAFVALNGHKDSTDQANALLEKHPEVQYRLAEIGSYVTLGAYEQDNDAANGKEAIEWLVLAKEDNRLLVVSRYALDCMPYNTELAQVTWASCTLRTWLDNDFSNEAFSAAEKAMIHTNPGYTSSGVNVAPYKVFLLSSTEVEKYIGSGSALRCKVTAYALSQGAGYTLDYNALWWLRTPYGNGHAAYVTTDFIATSGAWVNAEIYAVRPALWIELVE